jgi:glutaredoxin
MKQFSRTLALWVVATGLAAIAVGCDSGGDKEPQTESEGTTEASDEGEASTNTESAAEPGENGGTVDEGGSDSASPEGAGEASEEEEGEAQPGTEDGEPGEGNPIEEDGGDEPIIEEEGGSVDQGGIPGAVCPYAEPQGTMVGDYLKNVKFTKCNGDVVSMWDVSCGSSVTWFFFTTSWCPYCTKVSNALDSVYAKFKDKGVKIAVIVWENDFGGAPTAPNCAAYAEKYGLEESEVIVAIDPIKEQALQFYEADQSGSIVVSLSVVTNRFGEIVLKNSATEPGAMEWQIRHELEKMWEELGWDDEGNPPASNP